MADITTQGTVTFYFGGSVNDTTKFDLGYSVTATGSQFTDKQQIIPSGSATALITSSLSNVGIAMFKNMGTGSVEIATDSAFTKRVCVMVVSGSPAIIPWSGSIANASFYARGLDQSGTVIRYAIREQ